ncbi:MAG: hypothetical protein R2939_04605 [Kofleriaceae bacterium]
MQLYDGLVALAPSLGARIARAAAVLEVHGAVAALAALEALPAAATAGYQPFHVVRAEALAATGDVRGAVASLDRALGLTEDPGLRAFLVERRGHVARRGA